MTDLFPHLHTIALMGRIGSGKSTARAWFEAQGIETIDGDQLVHELYQPEGLGCQKIKTFFGEEFLTREGSVNRKKLLRTLGKSPKKWEVLNRIVLPLVADQIQRKLHKAKGPYVVIELQNPETRPFKAYLDEYWTIEATPETRRQRLLEKKWTSTQIDALEQQQANAHFPQEKTIENEGDLKTFHQNLEKAWNAFLICEQDLKSV